MINDKSDFYIYINSDTDMHIVNKDKTCAEHWQYINGACLGG